MKHGGSHSKTAVWYGLKWNKLWLDFTLGLHNLCLGIYWHIQLNKKYRRTINIRTYFIFLDISFYYFIDPEKKVGGQ